MDFENFRLFVISNTFPEAVAARSTTEMSDSCDQLSEEGWSHVNHEDLAASVRDGEGHFPPFRVDSDETELRVGSRQQSSVEDRLSRSLDLGHGSMDTATDGLEGSTSNSIPWQSGRYRTLERSSGIAATNSGSSIGSQSEGLTSDRGGADQTEKLKNKLMSAWNNMKYGWSVKTKTSFKCDSPIWLLGKCYHCTKADQEENKPGMKAPNSMYERFIRDFASRIWFTYRKDFPLLDSTFLSTDVGWGCMLRSGQMLLVQALLTHYLGRDWRWHSQQRTQEDIFHHQIIKFFGDQAGDECPFSIHKLVQIGAESGKRPGDWYGPASVAFVLREAMEQASEANPILSNLCLYVAQDCTVYKQDVIDLCTRTLHSSRRSSISRADSTSSEQSAQGGAEPAVEEHWRSVIILVPVRLGGEVLNPIYVPCMQSMLAHDLCLGIMGGKPKHSLYFVGWQDDKMIHLDPHYCQDYVDVRQRGFPLHSFHCLSAKKMPFSKMDPSCTVGFYCKTKADFYKFVREVELMVSPPKERGLYPMFVFHEGRSIDISLSDQVQQPKKERYLRVRRLDRKGRVKSQHKEADDFVFL